MCEPAFSSLSDHLSTGASLALADSPGGTLVLAVGGNCQTRGLFRFGTECELIDRSLVVTDGQGIVNPGIAVGEGALALAWSATTEDFGETAFYRVLGGKLCD